MNRLHSRTDGHIGTWNLGAERIKGYTASEIIGKHFSIFYPPEDRYGFRLAHFS